jgi:hypothetical protein
MICQGCGVEAATKYVSFHQNIGALFVRFPKSIEGSLCKSCIHKHFLGMTLTTLFLGWWGTISLIITPFLLLNNIIRYVFCLGMPPVAAGAVPPELTEDAVEKIKPFASDLFTRLNDDEKLETVAPLIAERAGVTPGQVVLFIHAVAESQSQS